MQRVGNVQKAGRGQRRQNRPRDSLSAAMAWLRRCNSTTSGLRFGATKPTRSGTFILELDIKGKGNILFLLYF